MKQAAPESAPGVEQHFRVSSPDVRATYAAIIASARRLGRVVEDPKKTSIHLVRTTAFAGVATQRAALVLTVKSDHDVPSTRLKKRERVSANRWHLEVRLTEPSQVDDEVRSWLERAYSLAGPRSDREATKLPSKRTQMTKSALRQHRRRRLRS